MKIILLILLLFLAHSMITPQKLPYTQAYNRPLNIAHRGLSSIVPENTIQAFEAALYQGADFIELDVQITKDNHVIVLHDPFLNQLTDIHKFPELVQQLAQTRQYQQKNRTSVWADQLTLQQIRKLTIKQKIVKNRIKSFDYILGVSTLKQTIQAIMQFNKQSEGKRNPDGRIGGILIEAKDSKFYRQRFNIQIGQKIYEILKNMDIETQQKCAKLCPIVLQSFDLQTVKYWHETTNLPKIYLSKHKDILIQELSIVAKYAEGVGVRQTFFYDYDNKKIDRTLLDRVRQLGLLVYSWTFKDDQLVFNSPNNLRMYEVCQKQLKLDGIITQFPDIYTPISQIYREQMYEEQAHNGSPNIDIPDL